MVADASEILQFYSGRCSNIIAEIAELVDIESPSNDVSASRKIADLLESKFRSIGIETGIERIDAGVGEHLSVKLFRSDMPSTLLLGHTDTVHPVGTRNANLTRVADGRMYGCGIFDMKANIVVMLEVLRYFALTGQRPSSPVSILLSCDEEVGSRTGRPLVESASRGSYRCFVFEPSANGRVKTGRKGTAVFTLKAHGIPAHAGLEPEKGANAIAELARHIDEIHAVAAVDEGTTVNVTTISGGTTTNVIPEHAKCEIDVRFSTLAEGERVRDELQKISSSDPQVSIELLGAINRPPLERTPEVVALFENARIAAASLGFDLDETQVGGASDGNIAASMGVPVLDGLGVAGDGAHTLDEYILIDDIPRRAALITRLLLD